MLNYQRVLSFDLLYHVNHPKTTAILCYLLLTYIYSKTKTTHPRLGMRKVETTSQMSRMSRSKLYQVSKMLIVSSPVYLVLGSSKWNPLGVSATTFIAYAMDVDDDRGVTMRMLTRHVRNQTWRLNISFKNALLNSVLGKIVDKCEIVPGEFGYL